MKATATPRLAETLQHKADVLVRGFAVPEPQARPEFDLVLAWLVDDVFDASRMLVLSNRCFGRWGMWRPPRSGQRAACSPSILHAAD